MRNGKNNNNEWLIGEIISKFITIKWWSYEKNTKN